MKHLNTETRTPLKIKLEARKDLTNFSSN